MRDLILGFKFAVSYFSILPIAKFKEDEDVTKKEVLNASVITLPLVGLILGTITVLLYSFLDSIPWLGAIIASCIYFILYGFLHTEAILDVVDAIYAKHSGKDPYKIIKESTVGAIGVLYSLVFVIGKIAAMSYLLINGFIYEILFVITFSRFTTGANLYFFSFKSSFLTMLKNSIKGKSYLISLSIFLAFFIIFIGFNTIYLSVFMFLFAFLFINFIKRNLGFLNGDALGMTLEMVELSTFILICYLIAI